MNPTLRLIMNLREGLEKGDSIRRTLESFIQEEEGALPVYLQRWWLLKKSDQNSSMSDFSLSQQSVVSLIERGLQGETIGPALSLLEREVFEKCESEIDEFAQTLPIKSLLPLLLLIFPAYLMILLGPLVEELLSSLNQ